MKTNHFEDLHALGYQDLIPIIPPEAPLSERSKIREKDRGKVPGRKNGASWAGFPKWQDYQATREDLATWHKWRANCGLRTGDVFGLDVDITDEPVSSDICEFIQRRVGRAPMRIGNAPKALLVYRCDSPTYKRKARFRLPDGSEHAIELLGKGQQFVAHGVHPKTKRLYRWRNTDTGTLPPLKELIELTDDTRDTLWASLLERMVEHHGAELIDDTAGSKQERTPIGAPQMLGDPEALKEAIELLPNDNLDYDDWIRLVAAIKAGFGGDEDYYPVFERWCLKYAGNTPEDVRRRWDSVTSSELGANYVFDQARAHGYNDAGDVFEADDDFDIGVDHLRSRAVDRMFLRYVFVEEIMRFVDPESGHMLSKEQFNLRHTEIGNPASSRSCASMTFLRDQNRRQVVWSMTYRPGGERFVEENGVRCLNSWRPGYLKEETRYVRDSEVSQWMALVEHVIPDASAREIILDWAAYLLKFPGEKCNWAVLLGSTAQGIGKDMMFQPIIQGLGEHNVTYVGPQDIASTYTDWAAETKLVVVEEMHAFERKETMNKLKAFITAPPDMVRINKKFMPQYQIPNLGAYLFFTNMHNALYLEKSDRRFYVYWSPAKPDTHGLYAKVAAWYGNGGAQRVVGWLKQRSLANFEPKGQAPGSESKEEMRRIGQDPVAEWVEVSIEDHLPPFDTDLIVLDEVLAALPPRVERLRPTRERLVSLLKSCGAEMVARVRLKDPLPKCGLQRARIYAIRRVPMYMEQSPAELMELYSNQTASQSADSTEFPESDEADSFFR